MKKVILGIIVVAVVALIGYSLFVTTQDEEVERVANYTFLTTPTNRQSAELTLSENGEATLVRTGAGGEETEEQGTWVENEGNVEVTLTGNEDGSFEESRTIVFTHGAGGTLTAIEYNESIYGEGVLTFESTTGTTVEDFSGEAEQTEEGEVTSDEEGIDGDVEVQEGEAEDSEEVEGELLETTVDTEASAGIQTEEVE